MAGRIATRELPGRRMRGRKEDASMAERQYRERVVRDEGAVPAAPLVPDDLEQTVAVERTAYQRDVVPARPAVYRERATYVEEAPAYVEPAAVVERTVYPTAYQINRIIWYFFGLLEGLLAIRFALRAIGANPENGFAAFIYALTGPFVAPFNSLVAEPAAGGAVFEITTLVAMLVYLLLGYAVTKLVAILMDSYAA